MAGGARGGAWVLTGWVVTFVGGIAGTSAAAHLLAPPLMGAYLLTISIVAFSALVAQLGLQRVVVRLVAQSLALGQAEQAPATVVRAVRVAAVSAACTTVLLAGGLGSWLGGTVFDDSNVAAVATLTALWTGFDVVRTVIAEAFRGYHDFRRATTLGDPLRSVLVATALWTTVLLVDGASLHLVVSIAAVSSVLTLVLGMSALSRAMGRTATAPALGMGATLSIGLPLMLTDAAAVVLTWGDLWVVGIFRGAEDVARYGAAIRLVVFLRVGMLILNTVVAPTIAQLHVLGERKQLEDVIRSAATTATLPMVAALLIIFTFAGDIMGLVYGDFYRDGAILLVILSIGEAANVLFGPTGPTLAMTGNHHIQMVVSLVVGALTLGLEVIAVHVADLVAVASVSAAGIGAQHALMAYAARRRLGVATWTWMSPKRIPYSISVLRGRASPDGPSTP